LAQYLGFSDFFGRLLTELPNYATRLGNLMLNILRRVLSNPVAVMTMVTVITIAYYAVDNLMNGFLNYLEYSLQSFQSYANQLVNQLTTGSCGVGDFVCYIENGLIMLARFILQYVFLVLFNALMWFVEQVINAIDYVVKFQIYVVHYVLCNYIVPAFNIVNTAYVGGKVITGIWRLMAGRGPARWFSTLIGGLGATLLTYVFSNAFLNFVFNLTGVACKPGVVSLPTPTPPPVTPPPKLTSQVMGLSETLSYTLGSGSPGRASLSLKESMSYHVGTTGAPKLKVLLSEALGYALKYIPPDQASVKFSLSESLGYKLVSSAALGALLVMGESLTYLASVSVSAPKPKVYCTVSGTSIVCYSAVEEVAVESPVTISTSSSAGAQLK
jgi:hypothetical protein